MPLCREVSLSPISDIVLDGDPAPPLQKGAEPPIFDPCLLLPNGWMDELKMPLITEVDLSPGLIVLDGDPAPRERGTAALPSFRSMPIVATVAHLSWC